MPGRLRPCFVFHIYILCSFFVVIKRTMRFRIVTLATKFTRHSLLICILNVGIEYEINFMNLRTFLRNKRQKDCLWKQRTRHRSENRSLGFTDTLHKQ